MRWLFGILVMLLALLGLVGPTGAAPTQVSVADIADELDATGRYVETGLSGAEEAAIEDANGRGIAFVWIDSEEEPAPLADSLSLYLDDVGSPFRTVLVLSRSGVAAASEWIDDDTIENGLDASFDQLASGAIADGVDSFSSALGQSAGSVTSPSTTSPPSGSSGSSGGIGIGRVLLVVAAGGGGFLLFRSWRQRSKAKEEAAAELEADRAEITEQLRDNADHVLSLGDRVIGSGDPELISTYEQASAAYQEVSRSIGEATSASEIDALDDKIDHAEWQFESIEAKLEGRPVPPSPAEIQAKAEASPTGVPPAPSSSDRDQPALGPDESVLPGDPDPRSQTRYQQPRRRGGGLGGLGGVLGGIVLGSGGLGGGSRSRRSQRRTPSYSSRSTGGGLGGGVLRRGGGSSSRRHPRASGSRSFGRRGGRGSRSF